MILRPNTGTVYYYQCLKKKTYPVLQCSQVIRNKPKYWYDIKLFLHLCKSSIHVLSKLFQ